MITLSHLILSLFLCEEQSFPSNNYFFLEPEPPADCSSGTEAPFRLREMSRASSQSSSLYGLSPYESMKLVLEPHPSLISLQVRRVGSFLSQRAVAAILSMSAILLC